MQQEMELSKMTMEIFTKLEQQWLSTTAGDTKKARILSIDGGGTSPAVAGAYLVHLEALLQQKSGDPSARIADFFDLIAASGVSAVLAVLLSAADPSSGRPLFSAREALSLLADSRPLMFKPKKRSFLSPRRGPRRCSGESLRRFLESSLKNLTLKDMCRPILVPCYDLATSAPFVFSRAAAGASGWASLDFELWKVCRAAVSTPGVFAPFSLSSVDGKTSLTAVDGGVVMNNPAAAAVTHVLHNKADFPSVNGVEDLMVLSLGNGAALTNGGGERESEMGSVVRIAMEGASETVDQMLGNAFSWNRSDYVRIQANGLGGAKPMTREDALKERGVESLTFGGKRLLAETNGERIEGFAQRLVAASARSSLPPSPYKSLSPVLDGR